MAEKKETKKQELNELVFIQSTLKAPKNQRNNFGGYNYRSCEDIMEAVKPLLKETNCTLVISDEIVQVADRIYVKATATLKTPSGEEYKNTAYAREALSKKGMDESQVTGAASSYARKYALNGLFCIDDTKDADALNVNKDYTQQQQPVQQQKNVQPQVQQQQQVTVEQVMAEIAAAKTEQELGSIYYKYPQWQRDANFTGALTARKDQLKNNGKS
jgi:hypothetical protein